MPDWRLRRVAQSWVGAPDPPAPAPTFRSRRTRSRRAGFAGALRARGLELEGQEHHRSLHSSARLQPSYPESTNSGLAPSVLRPGSGPAPGVLRHGHKPSPAPSVRSRVGLGLWLELGRSTLGAVPELVFWPCGAGQRSKEW